MAARGMEVDRPTYRDMVQGQPQGLPPQLRQPRQYNNNNNNNNNQHGYLSNGAAPQYNDRAGAASANSNGRVITTPGGARVLCVADVRGNLRSLNELARTARADHIIHTGDFGFYDDTSLDRIAEKTLKHVAAYSPLISESVRKSIAQHDAQSGSVKSKFQPSDLPLSELSSFLKGTYKLDVPVYTVWGACEDVRVLEKFRSGEYKVEKLHIIDEARSMLLDLGGVKLRLFGLGGAVVMHKLFDNGQGRTTIAGGQGTMWTTILQMGELIDTANRVWDPTETRVLITHASPTREGLLNQLAVTLKADFSISAGLHFRYGSSYNEFSVNPTLDHYRGKLAGSRLSFYDVWETVKSEVQPMLANNEAQQSLLQNALNMVEKMPSTAHGGNPYSGQMPNAGQVDESAFKNLWNFNLADATFGYLVLELEGGRIGTEMRAQGFNFAHRSHKQVQHQTQNQQQPPQGPGLGNAGIPNQSMVAPAGLTTQNRSPAPTANTPQPFSQNQNQNRGPNTQQQPRGPPAPNRASDSPASFEKKLSTPAPVTASAPTVAKENEKTSAATPTDSSASVAEKTTSPAPKTPAAEIIGLFVMNTNSEDAVRDIFGEADKLKITKVEKWGAANRVAHFKTIEDRDAALANLPEDVKTSSGDRSKPLVKLFQPKNNDRSYNPTRGGSTRGGAGNWGSSRGSDSESGRGGRGGRGRGGERGRGGRGRGGAASASTAAATTTAASTVSAANTDAKS